MTNNNKLITSIFKDPEDVEKGYQHVISRGYKPEEINLIMSDETRNKHFKTKEVRTELTNKSIEGLGVGGVIGGTVGGIAAAITAIGTALILPGLGIIVAGPLAAGLAGIGAGGVAGGLIGALIGMGIPEERLKLYEKEINTGGILLAVNSRSDEDAENITKEWEKYRK